MQKMVLSVAMLVSGVMFGMSGGDSPDLIKAAIEAVKKTGTTKSYAEINDELRRFALKGLYEKQLLKEATQEAVNHIYENYPWEPMGTCHSWKHLSPEAQAVCNAGALLLPE